MNILLKKPMGDRLKAASHLKQHTTRSHRLWRRRHREEPSEEETTISSLRIDDKEGQTDPALSLQGERRKPFREKADALCSKPWFPVLRVLSKLYLVALALWLVFAQAFAVMHVSGQSMYPNILDGDMVVAFRLQSTYAQEDVVIYRLGVSWQIGRIVAQAGDVVDITEDGYLTVNGNLEQEEKVYYETTVSVGNVDLPYTVPEDSYFVLSDYRTAGYDSRDIGAIARDDLVGKVISLLRLRGI